MDVIFASSYRPTSRKKHVAPDGRGRQPEEAGRVLNGCQALRAGTAGEGSVGLQEVGRVDRADQADQVDRP